MTSYCVGIIKRQGGADAWVFDLPGCRAVGGSVDEVMSLVPVVIAEHVAWLDEHGDVTSDAFPFGFKVVEEVEQTPDIGEFCFDADKAPLTSEDIERAVRQIGYAHDDLTSLIRPLPDVLLDWKPPASAVKIDQIYPDVRTIREMVAHVASALTFHLRGVGDLTTRVPSPDDPPDLLSAFDTTLARLRALNDEERSGKVYRREGPRGNEWTARKSLRRLPNHQRFHTREIQQRLCWLTLGVPEVLPVSRE